MSDLDYALSIINKEIIAANRVIPLISDQFQHAVDLCRNCVGNILFSGTGKSSIVAQKLAATLSSLGKPAWFIHPNDAEHGDIGKIRSDDIAILLSNSGETGEILVLIDRLKSKGCKLIGIVGKLKSTMASKVDVALELSDIEEAGTVKMVPTSSTTAMMILGDALVLTIVGPTFTNDDYRRNHPGGTIGLRLSRVDDIMRKGNDCPIVDSSMTIVNAMLIITAAHAGAAIIVDNGSIKGIITDGDLRRFYERGGQINSALVNECMTTNPIVIESGKLVEDALILFKEKSIGELPVIDGNSPIGLVTLKDIAKLL